MELFRKSLLSLFILLFLGNSYVSAHMQQGLIVLSSLQVHVTPGSLSILADDNGSNPTLDFGQPVIKKEKAIIDDTDDEDDDEDHKLAVCKKYSLTGNYLGISFYVLTPDAYCGSYDKRRPIYSKHFANTSFSRLFIRNRVIRI